VLYQGRTKRTSKHFFKSFHIRSWCLEHPEFLHGVVQVSRKRLSSFVFGKLSLTKRGGKRPYTSVSIVGRGLGVPHISLSQSQLYYCLDRCVNSVSRNIRGLYRGVAGRKDIPYGRQNECRCRSSSGTYHARGSCFMCLVFRFAFSVQSCSSAGEENYQCQLFVFFQRKEIFS
jgi:hypothetical protein